MPIDDRENEYEEVAEKKSPVKKVLLIIFVVIPLVIVLLLYVFNSNFKNSANNLLKKVPVVRDIVGSFPTEEELADREQTIAKHYIEDLDIKSAADKLYIVKKEDDKLYRSLTARMDKLSPDKTKSILEEVRNLELRKDLVANLYEDVEDEKTINIEELTAKLEAMGTRVAVEEINRGDIVTEEDFMQTLVHMNDEAAVDILYYLDGGARSNILFKLSNENMKRKKELQSLLNTKRVDEEELNFTAVKMAEMYSVKKPEESIEEIGNDEDYSLDLLSRVYMNLPPAKSAEILIHAEEEDEEFLTELFASIRQKEELLGMDESIGVDINNIMAYLNEYNEKVDDLTEVYDKMEEEPTARTLEQLLQNKEEITVFTIDEQEGYKLSDYTVAIDIMKRLKNNKLAKIFAYMTPEQKAQITKILAVE